MGLIIAIVALAGGKARGATNSGQAIAGLVCSILALIIAIDLSVHVGTWAARNSSVFTRFDKCVAQASNGPPSPTASPSSPTRSVVESVLPQSGMQLTARLAQSGRLLTAWPAWLAAAGLAAGVGTGRWRCSGPAGGSRRHRRRHLRSRPRHPGDRPGTGNRTRMSTEGVTGPGIAGKTAPPRFGVRSMSAPLRRVLLRRPSVTGDFAAAAWRAPDAGLLARQQGRSPASCSPTSVAR